jgi:hypothetical protein
MREIFSQRHRARSLRPSSDLDRETIRFATRSVYKKSCVAIVQTPDSRARHKLFAAMSIICLAIAHCLATGAQTSGSSAQLTVDRIYAAPSLSGNLTEGVQWSPDGTLLAANP